MPFFKSKQPESPVPLPKSPHLILQQAFTHIDSTFSYLQNHTKQAIEARFSRVHFGSYQTHLESTFSHLQNHTRQAIESGFSQFRSGFHQTHLESALSNFHSHAKQAIEAGFLRFRFNSRPNSSGKSPTWARIGENVRSRGVSMSNEDIEERLAGVPVYALSNSSGEFVLVSGLGTGKNLGLFCFKEEIAEALLQQMKSMEPDMRDGSKVVALALNKVFQLKLDDVAFRFVPDPSQIKYALEERRKAGFSDEVFPGVPVFQGSSEVGWSPSVVGLRFCRRLPDQIGGLRASSEVNKTWRSQIGVEQLLSSEVAGLEALSEVIETWRSQIMVEQLRGAPFSSPCAIAPLDMARAFVRLSHVASPLLRQGATVCLAAPRRAPFCAIDNTIDAPVHIPGVSASLAKPHNAALAPERMILRSMSGIHSRSLVLRSQNKRYRPVFFRREDLEKSLFKASREQNRLNPALREGDIQVAVLEEIIEGMKVAAFADLSGLLPFRSYYIDKA
ncbi:Tic22-like family protein [Actinidia rufa]|uniref:Tic22-like family protein n=1 Tax=Actinidia rufa TaxID=165716 RepID=A0A7J0F3L0_9ERIC|nr:Tic22-like family protein [Actinidia rufa]